MSSTLAAPIYAQLPADKLPRGQVLSSTVLQALGEAEAALGANYSSEATREKYVRLLLSRRGRENAEREEKRLRREGRWAAIADGLDRPGNITDDGEEWGE